MGKGHASGERCGRPCAGHHSTSKLGTGVSVRDSQHFTGKGTEAQESEETGSNFSSSAEI